ncbi:MAG: response regulator [Nitrospirota bacterium]
MAEPKPTEPIEVSDRRNNFLLVVDSDLTNLKYTSTLLRRFGYTIHTATSVGEALAVTGAKVPSLVITSPWLKDVDGLELMKKIKNDARTAGVPCLVLTRHGDLFQEARYFEAGATNCLSHPVPADLLYRAVQAVLELRPRMNIRIRTRQIVILKNAALTVQSDMYTLELSEQGMFLRISEPMDVGTLVQLELNLEGELLPVEAKVLYRHETAHGPYQEPGMGLEFIQIAPDDRNKIRTFIIREIMQGITPAR